MPLPGQIHQLHSRQVHMTRSSTLASYPKRVVTEFLRDLHFGLRLLAKSPVFTVTAALLLAVGISANTLIFSVVDALLLRPPASVASGEPGAAGRGSSDRFHHLGPALQAAATRWPRKTPAYRKSSARAKPTLLSATATLPNACASTWSRRISFLLWACSLISAACSTTDDERTAAPNAVLSYGFWQRRFQHDASVLGREHRLGRASVHDCRRHTRGVQRAGGRHQSRCPRSRRRESLHCGTVLGS